MMIKKIIPPLLMIAGVIGGGVAADFVKHGGQGEASETAHTKPKKDSTSKEGKDKGHGDKDDGHAKKDKKDKKDKKSKKKKKKDGHGDKGGHGDSLADGEPQYIKFKRQFVVPVMDGGNIDALVIMNLNVELTSDTPSNNYSYLPRMRDAMMRELLALSDRDVFGENLTSVENYQIIRERLLFAARTVLPDGVADILILDLARQEQ